MGSRTPGAIVPLPLLVAGTVIFAGLLGGCGGNSSAASHSDKATSPGALSRSSPPTASQAVAFARAVNLTAADVPGFTASSADEAETAQEQRLQRRLRACVGPAGFAAGLAAERSPPFKLNRDILELGVSSEVTVARSLALAAGELAAIRGGHIRACFSRYLTLLLESHDYRGVQLSPVSIASGTPPAPGATGSFGWRITAAFTVDRLRLSLYVDILGFVLGPARVTLVSSGAVRPFPAEIQQRLYSLLLARASARAR